VGEQTERRILTQLEAKRENVIVVRAMINKKTSLLFAG